MGNKFSHSKRPQKSYSSGANNFNLSANSTDNSAKIGISNIPANKSTMAPNSNSKEFGSIIKEIKKNPEFRNVELLPKDYEESDKLKKSIELINKNLKESDSLRLNSRGSNLTNSSSSNSNASRQSKESNRFKAQSNVEEDLSLKRKKLMEQLQRLNELENEKQIKLLEQERDLYVENLKLQDSFIVQESLTNYYKNSKDQSMSSFNSSNKKINSDSSSGDDFPFNKVKEENRNQSKVPVYVETRIPKLISVYKRENSPVYSNLPPLNSTLITDLNSSKTSNDYFSHESYKLSDKELDLILTAIMRYEKEEEDKRSKDTTGSLKKSKPSRYFYKDKQIYPFLDQNVLLNTAQSVNKKPTIMKEKVLKDLKIVNETNELLKKSNLNESKLNYSFNNQSIVSSASTTNAINNNTNNNSTNGSTYNPSSSSSRSSLSQVLKDIIIEFSNMSEEDFEKFKIELNNEMELAKKREAKKMVEEQQKLLEKQKIPKSVLEAYRNPYYEHCSDTDSIAINSNTNNSHYSSNRPKSMYIDSKFYPSVDSSMKKSQSLNLNSNNQLNNVKCVQRKTSNLKKLASRKSGEKIDEHEEDLYDPINYKFDEEIYH